jgi:hypothetical protein
MRFKLDKVDLGKDGEGDPLSSCVIKILTGNDFIKIELPETAQEMWDAFKDVATEQAINAGPSVAFCIIVSPNGAPCLPLMSLSCLPLFM